MSKSERRPVSAEKRTRGRSVAHSRPYSFVLTYSQLPLHAAIILRADEQVIKSVLDAYPYACRVQNEEGMLPIHLAIRNGASEKVIRMLIDFYPGSFAVKDNKGRTSLEIVTLDEVRPHSLIKKEKIKGHLVQSALTRFDRENILAGFNDQDDVVHSNNQSTIMGEKKNTILGTISKVKEKGTIEIQDVRDQIRSKATRAPSSNKASVSPSKGRRDMADSHTPPRKKNNLNEELIEAFDDNIFEAKEARKKIICHHYFDEAEFQSLVKKYAALKLHLENWKRKMNMNQFDKMLEITKVDSKHFEVELLDGSSSSSDIDQLAEDAQSNESPRVLKGGRHKLDMLEATENRCKELLEEIALRRVESKEEIKGDEDTDAHKVEIMKQRTTIIMLAEGQLESKIESERSLASRLSEIAKSVASTCERNRQTEEIHLKRATVLIQERNVLRSKNKELINKLKSVATFMSSITIDNQRLQHRVLKWEESMMSMEKQRHLLAQCMRTDHQVHAVVAQQNMNTLTKLVSQEEYLKQTKSESDKIQRALVVQGSGLFASKRLRGQLNDVCQKQNAHLIDIIDTMLETKSSTKTSYCEKVHVVDEEREPCDSGYVDESNKENIAIYTRV